MSPFHSFPAAYLELITQEVPDYAALQDAVGSAAERSSGDAPERVLDLGVGTGETARRVLAWHPGVELVGIDASDGMLEAARSQLGPDVDLREQRLEDPLPEGPFDVVTSALAVHHLDPTGKQELFRRVAEVLRTGGRFVLADVIVPDDPTDAVTPLEPEVDRPDRLDDQLRWLDDAGFTATVRWRSRDLVVVIADRRP